MKTVDRLLETQCFIIDFLPKQVPEESGEQFFRIENYHLNNYERFGIKDKIDLFKPKFVNPQTKYLLCESKFHRLMERWNLEIHFR